MRVSINLASQPHESLRPLRAAVALAAVVALVLTVVIVQRERRTRNEFRSLTERSERLEAERAELQREQQELEEWMGTPQAQQIRERSAFLNSLILRKGISWTQMFLDLEKTLPARARITSIRPRLTESQQAELDLTVAAESIGPLVEFLKSLESSPQFGSPAVGSQRFPSERAADEGISLNLTTRYQQTLPAISAPAADSDEAASADEVSARTGGLPEDQEKENP
jgi:type IV pilus assembly protein PilN